MKNLLLIFTILLNSCTMSESPITMEKKEDGLLILENGQKVMFYQTEPKNYKGEYERCNYIHPLWGLDGTLLTEDFPADHLHHRGIFWAWHQIWINGERIGDAWAIDHFEQRFKDISFSVEQGERIALLGSNGSGKSSILKLINGKAIPHTGKVNIGKQQALLQFLDCSLLVRPDNVFDCLRLHYI